ncbi:MAG: ATP-grasp domain-containing protein [Acidobacteriota bacterium]|nr:ATP-grasp domain-containing protein [Acidobacteriota bacterium]
MSISQTCPFTILCVASYHKGDEFIRECQRQGCHVLLLTSLSVGRDVWPLESIDEIFLMPDVEKKWNMEDVIKSVSFLARDRVINRIVPLDDFDLEKAATLREHLRTPGMGETTTRYFRDKLAMRMQAQEAGINVPEFIHVLNHERLREFAACTPAPWVLKPRFEASAVGIQKIRAAEELWPALEQLGDRQSFFVLERFVPGDIYHIDSIVDDQQVIFAIANRYGQPPLNVAHEGGVFSTCTIERGTPDEQALQAINRRVLSAMGLRRGVSHTEFIKGRADRQFYFLETSARVGGANIAELIEAATGINLWAEWAKLEVRKDYELPTPREDYAGLLVSLARQEYPDTSAYDDPEIVWRMNKSAHAGLIVKSPSLARVEQLLDNYTARFSNDFLATLPAPEKAVS